LNVDKYYSNLELVNVLKDWAEKHGDLMELICIGKSFEERPIWLAQLTNKKTGPDQSKPAIWIDANIHSVELAGTSVCMRIISHLLAKFEADSQITRLLNTSTFYVVPRMNPDGADRVLSSRPAFFRSGVRPMEHKGGLHEEDIDGDGRILQMRSPDPTGDWKISTLDPRLMEKREPHENGGTYYRLFTEGRIESPIKPRLELDFNRNFPCQWRPENEQNGAGPFPLSESETNCVARFIVEHPNINFAVSYHTSSGIILRPYSNRPDREMNGHDLEVYNNICGMGSKLEV